MRVVFTFEMGRESATEEFTIPAEVAAKGESAIEDWCAETHDAILSNHIGTGWYFPEGGK